MVSRSWTLNTIRTLSLSPRSSSWSACLLWPLPFPWLLPCASPMLGKTISSSPHVVTLKIRFSITPPPQFHVPAGLTILQNRACRIARWGRSLQPTGVAWRASQCSESGRYNPRETGDVGAHFTRRRMAARAGSPGRRPSNTYTASLVLPALAWAYLFFGILFTRFSDQRYDWPARHPSRRSLSGRRDKLLFRPAAFLVCAHTALVRRWQPCADVDHMARPACLCGCDLQLVATGRARGLPGMLFIFCRRSPGLFPLPV